MQEQNINKRMEICKSCPIFKPSDKTCNSKLWINPDTDEVSITPKSRFIRGCGCHLEFKTRSPYNHCIAGKW